MKKAILALCALLATAPAALAGGSMPYRLCAEPSTGTYIRGLAVGDEVRQAFLMDAAATTLYAGNSISAIQVAAPTNASFTNTATDIEVFLSYGLSQQPFYTQKGKLGAEGMAWNEIALDQPQAIEAGKPIYVGYSLAIPDKSTYYIIVDEMTDKAGSCYIGLADADGSYAWTDYSATMGCVCLGAVVAGDNLPVDQAALTAIKAPATVVPGQEFDLRLTVQNLASNAIDAMEVSVAVGSEPTATRTVALDAPLAYAETAYPTISGLVCNTIGSGIPIRAEITKVNGNANGAADKAVATTTMLCKLALLRNVVIEEGTGNWCQYCPAGEVLLRQIKENYTDGSFIPIAVHGGRDDEPMMSATYKQFLSDYVTGNGYPHVIINRDKSTAYTPNTSGIFGTVKSVYNQLRSQPATAAVDFTARYANDDHTALTVSTATTFADVGSYNYRLAIVLREDNVGPYGQWNAFSGVDYEMGGWETKYFYVSTTFDDVARDIFDYRGIAGSLPTEADAGETVEYTTDVPLDNVADAGRLSIVVMILNADNGQIENATQHTLAELLPASALTEVEAREPATTLYYDLLGRPVASPRSGCYIKVTTFADGTRQATKVAY